MVFFQAENARRAAPRAVYLDPKGILYAQTVVNQLASEPREDQTGVITIERKQLYLHKPRPRAKEFLETLCEYKKLKVYALLRDSSDVDLQMSILEAFGMATVFSEVYVLADVATSKIDPPSRYVLVDYGQDETQLPVSAQAFFDPAPVDSPPYRQQVRYFGQTHLVRCSRFDFADTQTPPLTELLQPVLEKLFK